MGNKIQSINWEEIEMETVNDSMCRRIVTGEKMPSFLIQCFPWEGNQWVQGDF